MVYSNSQKAILIISAFYYVIYYLMYQIIIIPKNQNLFLCEDTQVSSKTLFGPY